ncbi:MAG: rubredoxin [Planctomycetota bacterium]|jgi:rubredoxin
MKRYFCEGCGYVYNPIDGDPSSGARPGTGWERLADEWVCPVCGLGTESFSEYEEDYADEEF